MPRWPGFFIVGAMRAATTSLYHYLGQHPDVYMSPVKEPHFFSDYGDVAWTGGEPDAASLEDYLDLFADAGEAAVVGEASTSYLCDPRTPDRIHARVPDARILASLRDPIERAWSHFRMSRDGTRDDLRALLEDLDRDAPDWRRRYHFLWQGFYAEPVRRYRDRFGPDRVLVVTVDQLKADALGLLEEIAGFLGIDPGPMADVDHDVVVNPSGRARNPVADRIRGSGTLRRLARRVLPLRARRWIDEHLLLADEASPTLDEGTRRMLADLYADDVARLEEVLGRPLPELRAGRERPEGTGV